MILLVRVILIALIIYLLGKSFSNFWKMGDSVEDDRRSVNNDQNKKKKIPDEVGEFVDYEEVE
jgi:hypothetical protein